ncbi:hypothetical protein ELZ35_14460 [Enterococcus faecalis]|nr:hypothetical protein [Enterococcus faecalis]EGO7961213.1 hypothetical protein [Enterococcus faecalis]EGO8491416.1 hypothetical protein [Enterococcus faecalis]EGO8939125.1 hypothetical protein [Enterococcus faecalis]EHG5960336.1 hypothetical protein [Enterococcus faecalis]
MSNEEIIARLLEFNPLLKVADFWTNALRGIGYSILLGLKGFVDSLGDGVSQMYKVMNFWESPTIQSFIEPYRPIVISLMTLAMLWIAFRLMGDPKKDKQKIVNNVLFAILLFVGLPFFMTQAGQLVTAGRENLQSPSEATTQIFQNNITDLYAIDKQEWRYPDNDLGVNDIKTVNNLRLLDIKEAVDTGGLFFDDSPLSKQGKETLSKKVIEVNGEPQLAKMKGMFKFDEAYYRYTWHPWYILLELLAYGLVLIFTIFKTAKISYEIGAMKILSYGLVLTDLDSGQRNKTLFLKIRDSFIVLYLLSLLLNLFTIYMSAVRELSLDKPWDMIAILAGAMAAIDGPNIVEQLFGIDAGLSSVGRSLIGLSQSGMALSSAGRATAASVNKLGHMAKSVGGKAVRGATNTGSAIGGLLSGFKGNVSPNTEGGSLSNFKNEGSSGGNETSTNSNNNPEKGLGKNGSQVNEDNGNSNNTGEGPSDNGRPTPPTINDPKEAAKVLDKINGNNKEESPSHPGLGKNSETQNRKAKVPAPSNVFSKKGVQNQASKAPGALAAYQAGKGEKENSFTGVKANPMSLPSEVKEARAQLEKDLSVPMSTDTLNDALVDKYIGARQDLSKTKLVRGGARSFELGKNTGKKWRDKP